MVFNKFNAFGAALGLKKINLNSDTLKVMLTNTAPVVTDAVYADVSGTELANGNGYTTGGTAVASNAFSQSAGTAKLTAGSNMVFTASGGSIGPFRYAVLYDFSAASKDLIGWWDYGSAITLLSTETLNINFDPTNGILLLI